MRTRVANRTIVMTIEGATNTEVFQGGTAFHPFPDPPRRFARRGLSTSALASP